MIIESRTDSSGHYVVILAGDLDVTSYNEMIGYMDCDGCRIFIEIKGIDIL
jgi:hypothetical protein